MFTDLTMNSHSRVSVTSEDKSPTQSLDTRTQQVNLSSNEAKEQV